MNLIKTTFPIIGNKALRLYSRFMYMLVTMILVASCTVEDQDDTDHFVGTYSVSVTSSVTWGNSSGRTSDSGQVTISKDGTNRVKMSGFIVATGRVNGNDLYLDPSYENDARYGNTNTVYNVGTYNNGIINMTSTSTGQLKYTDGNYYPYRSYDTFTFIKK